MAGIGKNGHASASAMADVWTREADAVSLPRLEEVGGHPRPTGVGVTYAEQEYHALAGEQELAWPAEGEREARAYQVRARGLDLATTATEFLLSENEKKIREAHADHQHAARVLGPYLRHEPAAKLRYWTCWPILAIGDATGVLSAAIILGDIPWVAAGQALAAGLAAACAGLVGSELKHIQLARARQRDPESLTKDEQRYHRLFAGTGGTGIVTLIGLLSVTVVALLGIGIFALRSSIEGSSSGLTFGLLAAATAVASALLGYAAADEVADLLTAIAKRVRRAERRHLRLAAAQVPKVRAEADEAARSLRAEYQLRGHAAAKRVESLSSRVARNNPQVVGHGYPVGEQGGVIGRRARRGGGS